MPAFQLIIHAAVYLVLGYLLLFIPLVWLATRGEPELKGPLDLALRPVLWTLRLLLSPFGVKLKPAARPRELPAESPATFKAPGAIPSVRKAKEYLIGRIVAEAEREGVPLSDIERKMLYFSETDWTLPGILDVNAGFERDYDDAAYEEKIAWLVRSLQAHATSEEQETWDDAVIKLSEGDHYLLVMIGAGSRKDPLAETPRWLAPWLPRSSNEGSRPPGDLKRLIVAAIVGSLLMIGLALLRDRFR